MLKIHEPGSSSAVWAKNSLVLLPSQSVLLTKEQERTLCPGSSFFFIFFGVHRASSSYLHEHKVPSPTIVLLIIMLAGQLRRDVSVFQMISLRLRVLICLS